jgi:hypothetical protein
VPLDRYAAVPLLATTEIPIPVLMVAVGDPVRPGLGAHLAQPEENLAGLATLLQASMSNRLHLLHAVVPGLARVGILWLTSFLLGCTRWGPGLSPRTPAAVSYQHQTSGAWGEADRSLAGLALDDFAPARLPEI